VIRLWTPRRWVEQRVAHVLDRVANELDKRGDRRDEIGDDDTDNACDDSHDGVSCHTVAAVATWYRAAMFVRRWADEVRGGTKS
jgi:hypothetical protein